MTDSTATNPIWLTLEYDAHNVGEARKLLEAHGMMDLFERTPSLFDALPREVEAYMREGGINPYTRTDP